MAAGEAEGEGEEAAPALGVDFESEVTERLGAEIVH